MKAITIFTLGSLIIYACSNEGKFRGSSQRSLNPLDEDVSKSNQDINHDDPGKLIVSDDQPRVVTKDPATSLQDDNCIEQKNTSSSQLSIPLELWRWEDADVAATPIAGVLNGNIPSIIVASGVSAHDDAEASHSWYLWSLDGKTGQTQWKSPIRTKYLTPALGDIDNDGHNEVVALSYDHRVVAFDGKTGAIKWQSQKALSSQSYHLHRQSVILTDVDSDGNPEVIVGNKIFNGKDGSDYSSLNLLDEEGPILGIGDIQSSNPGKEIILQSSLIDARTGSRLCTWGFGKELKYASFSFIKSGDKDALIVGKVMDGGDRTHRTRLYGFNGKDCQMAFEIKIDEGGVGSPHLSDYDQDGILDIGVASFKKYYVFNADGTLKWSTQLTGSLTGTHGGTTFDFNGDGQLELVFADSDALRFYSASNGKKLFDIDNEIIGISSMPSPIIVDVNADGHADIVVPGNESASKKRHGVRVFTSDKNDWQATRSIWNQYHYYVHNVFENGKIPAYSQDVQSELDKRSKNTTIRDFRNNIAYSLANKEKNNANECHK